LNTLTADNHTSRAPPWLKGVAALGIAWNLFGLVQFAGSFTQTVESLMATGMTQAQAEVYLGLPAWVSVAFAVGVLGGFVGSIALWFRRKWAKPVFATSLLGYILLFAGDTFYGVFAAIPAQLAILAVVVLVAAALLWVSVLAGRRGHLNSHL
jgi:hypothetical protein